MKHHRDPETRRGADERELHIGPEPDDDVGTQGGIGAERRDEATLLAGEVEQRGHDRPGPLPVETRDLHREEREARLGDERALGRKALQRERGQG